MREHQIYCKSHKVLKKWFRKSYRKETSNIKEMIRFYGLEVVKVTEMPGSRAVTVDKEGKILRVFDLNK